METQRSVPLHSESDFTVENFKADLPELRRKIGILQIGASKDLITSLNDEDYLKIYSEWLYRQSDMNDARGYLFEVFASRYINSSEKNTVIENKVKDIFVLLTQYQNQSKLWGGSNYQSYPDDIVVAQVGSRIEIKKLVEVKTKRSSHIKAQQAKTVKGVASLINALNGAYGEIRTEDGRRILDSARQKLQLLGVNWINLSSDYQNVLALPADETPGENRERLEVVLVPITSTAIGILSETITRHFQRKYATLPKIGLTRQK